MAIVYGVLPFALTPLRALLHPDAYGGFWAPDSGARFAMIRNWVEHGSLIHLYYPYSDLDPSGQIHPLAYFLFHRPHDFTSMYSPVFPFLCGLTYRAVGFAGLTLVPALCGLGCVFVTYVTARRLGLRSRLLLMLALGLATPLVIYSCVFWEHSAMMLLAALTGYWVLRAFQDGSLRTAFVTGAVVASGMWLHEQFLALFAASWLAALPLLKSRRPLLVGLPLGFFAVALLWAVFNRYIYGTFAGPHLGANVVQNNADHPFSLATILNMTDFADRAMAQLVGTTLPGSAFSVPPSAWPYYLALACLLVVYAFWPWDDGRRGQTVFCLALMLASAALALSCVIRIHQFATPAGLFEATPLLIPALIVPWNARRTSGASCPTDLYFAWLSRACWLFLLFLLINPMYPGTDWGSRYLLTALPLLALLSACALERQHDAMPGLWRRLVPPGVGALAGVSLVCQVYGLAWIHRSLAYDADLNTRLATIHAPVLVTDSDFNARLASWPTSQARFVVRTDDDAEILAKVLGRLRVAEVAYVGVDGSAWQVEQALAIGHHRFLRVEDRLLFPALPGNEAGDELRLVRFLRKPNNILSPERRSASRSAVSAQQIVRAGRTDHVLPIGGPDRWAKHLPAASPWADGSFTIEQWFTRADVAANFQTLFSLATDKSHYLVAHPARGDDGTLSVDFDNGGRETSLRAPAPGQGKRTLLTVTYDATRGLARLYLNGEAITSRTVMGGFDLTSTGRGITTP